MSCLPVSLMQLGVLNQLLIWVTVFFELLATGIVRTGRLGASVLVQGFV